MDEKTLVFHKILLSAYSKRIFFALVLPAIICILLYLRTAESIFTFFSVGFLFPVFIKAIDVFTEPASVTLADSYIKVGNIVVEWNAIDKIKFHLPYNSLWDGSRVGGGVLLQILVPVQEIEIHHHKSFLVRVHPKIYEHNNLLRSRVEDTAREKGIKVWVEDR